MAGDDDDNFLRRLPPALAKNALLRRFYASSSELRERLDAEPWRTRLRRGTYPFVCMARQRFCRIFETKSQLASHWRNNPGHKINPYHFNKDAGGPGPSARRDEPRPPLDERLAGMDTSKFDDRGGPSTSRDSGRRSHSGRSLSTTRSTSRFSTDRSRSRSPNAQGRNIFRSPSNSPYDSPEYQRRRERDHYRRGRSRSRSRSDDRSRSDGRSRRAWTEVSSRHPRSRSRTPEYRERRARTANRSPTPGSEGSLSPSPLKGRRQHRSGTFNSDDDLLVGLQEETGRRPSAEGRRLLSQCVHCGDNFTSNEDLHRHLDERAKAGDVCQPSKFRCFRCRMAFGSQEAQQQHRDNLAAQCPAFQRFNPPSPSAVSAALHGSSQRRMEDITAKAHRENEATRQMLQDAAQMVIADSPCSADKSPSPVRSNSSSFLDKMQNELERKNLWHIPVENDSEQDASQDEPPMPGNETINVLNLDLPKPVPSLLPETAKTGERRTSGPPDVALGLPPSGIANEQRLLPTLSSSAGVLPPVLPVPPLPPVMPTDSSSEPIPQPVPPPVEDLLRQPSTSTSDGFELPRGAIKKLKEAADKHSKDRLSTAQLEETQGELLKKIAIALQEKTEAQQRREASAGQPVHVPVSSPDVPPVVPRPQSEDVDGGSSPPRVQGARRTSEQVTGEGTLIQHQEASAAEAAPSRQSPSTTGSLIDRLNMTLPAPDLRPLSHEEVFSPPRTSIDRPDVSSNSKVASSRSRDPRLGKSSSNLAPTAADAAAGGSNSSQSVPSQGSSPPSLPSPPVDPPQTSSVAAPSRSTIEKPSPSWYRIKKKAGFEGANKNEEAKSKQGNVEKPVSKSTPPFRKDPEVKANQGNVEKQVSKSTPPVRKDPEVKANQERVKVPVAKSAPPVRRASVEKADPPPLDPGPSDGLQKSSARSKIISSWKRSAVHTDGGFEAALLEADRHGAKRKPVVRKRQRSSADKEPSRSVEETGQKTGVEEKDSKRKAKRRKTDNSRERAATSPHVADTANKVGTDNDPRDEEEARVTDQVEETGSSATPIAKEPPPPPPVAETAEPVVETMAGEEHSAASQLPIDETRAGASKSLSLSAALEEEFEDESQSDISRDGDDDAPHEDRSSDIEADRGNQEERQETFQGVDNRQARSEEPGGDSRLEEKKSLGDGDSHELPDLESEASDDGSPKALEESSNGEQMMVEGEGEENMVEEEIAELQHGVVQQERPEEATVSEEGSEEALDTASEEDDDDAMATASEGDEVSVEERAGAPLSNGFKSAAPAEPPLVLVYGQHPVDFCPSCQQILDPVQGQVVLNISTKELRMTCVGCHRDVIVQAAAAYAEW